MIDSIHTIHHSRAVQYPRGSTWTRSSHIWGERAGVGDALEQRSPVNDSIVQHTQFLNSVELDALVQAAQPTTIDRIAVWQFAERLHAALADLAPALLEAMRYETGFTAQDCAEMLEGSLAYVQEFRGMVEPYLAAPAADPIGYALPHQRRHISLARVAYGTVAVVLPQNAFLLIAVTALLNGLATGNRVILRAPQQSARSAALFAAALATADVPARAGSIVLAKARAFIEALCRSPQPILIHYMGSSQHAPQIMADAFRGGKPMLIDGTGNGWMWVGPDVPVATAVRILTEGATRYNGQTCTSINGAVIHPVIYDAVRQQLTERWTRLTVGNPVASTVDIGPLFDQEQAAWCQQQVQTSGGRIICGGDRSGNVWSPTLVDQPRWDSALVREGLFGPGLWIAPGDQNEFVQRWPSNQYPLCAGVLAPSADAQWWAARVPHVARLVINGDPSIEYIFEPWGGYPLSGANGVSLWHEKYQRVISIDQIGV